MSRRASRHRKPSRYVWSLPNRNARHRKPSPIATALQAQPARLAASAAASTLIVAGLPGATHLAHPAAHPAAFSTSTAASAHTEAATGTALVALTEHAKAAHLLRPGPAPAGRDHGAGQDSAALTRYAPDHPVAPAYRNPLRDVSGLLPERVDQGVDFGGSGPVYALGDAVITNASGSNWGWPGGGWITYRLTDGPAAGLTVFLAEDVTPTVQAGQHVSSGTVIATMFDGGDGIETGWAQPDGFSAESQLPEAGGISGYGPFPTVIGMNFEGLLESLGVPAGNNASEASYGYLPARYPSTW